MEFDYDLTPDQWETLKVLRKSAHQQRHPNRFVVEQLVSLDLVTMIEGLPVITAAGRKVLVRGGSSRLLDVVA